MTQLAASFMDIAIGTAIVGAITVVYVVASISKFYITIMNSARNDDVVAIVLLEADWLYYERRIAGG